MPASEFVIETDPTPEQVQYLEDRLYEFNSSVTRITDGEGLAIFVRGEGEQIVAGICGNTWGGYPRGHQNLVLRKRLGEAS